MTEERRDQAHRDSPSRSDGDRAHVGDTHQCSRGNVPRFFRRAVQALRLRFIGRKLLELRQFDGDVSGPVTSKTGIESLTSARYRGKCVI